MNYIFAIFSEIYRKSYLRDNFGTCKFLKRYFRTHTNVSSFPFNRCRHRGVQMIPFSHELGTPSNCQRGRSAMPRVLLRSRVWFLDTMLIMHQPTNWKPAFLFFLFLSERYDQNNDPKKHKSNHNLSLKKKEEKMPAFIFFARAVQIPGLIFRSKTVNLSGASQKCHFPHSSSKTPDLCMESNFCNIFWWVANWAIKPCSMFLSLQHCLHQVSPWSGTTIFIRI